MDDRQRRGGLSRNAGQIADAIVGINRCVTGWIDDRYETTRVVIDVADVGGGAGSSEEYQSENGDNDAYTTGQPLAQAIQNHADRCSGLKLIDPLEDQHTIRSFSTLAIPEDGLIR